MLPRNFTRNFKRSFSWFAAASLVGTLLVLVVACGSGNGTTGNPESITQAPVNQAPVNRGAPIFLQNCATCHGQNAEGQPDWHIRKNDGTLPAPPLNGDGHTWHHGDGTLYTFVNLGGAYLEGPDVPGFKSAMPAFGGQLSHQEIVDVISYLKTIWEGKEFQGVAKTEAQALASENDPFPPAPQ